MKQKQTAYLALAAVCLLWGTTYLALRVGVTQFPPFLFSAIRFVLAGVILIGILLLRGHSFPSQKVIFNQAIGGFLMCTMGISLVGWAEVQVSSGVAAIICSLMPIWVFIINLLINQEEKPTLIVMMGLAMGIVGILLIFREHLTEFYQPQYLGSIVAIFLANLSWAIGTFWLKKKNAGTDPFINAGLQMLAGGIFLIPFTLLFDDLSVINWSGEVIFALSYLTLIGSVAAYACYFYAVGHLPIMIVSLYAYINPVIAVILGWLVLNEKMNSKIAGAILLTLLGIYLVNKGHQLKSKWRGQPKPIND